MKPSDLFCVRPSACLQTISELIVINDPTWPATVNSEMNGKMMLLLFFAKTVNNGKHL